VSMGDMGTVRTEWRKLSARRAEAGSGVFGEEQPAPSPPARGMGSAVSFISGVRDEVPAAVDFVVI